MPCTRRTCVLVGVWLREVPGELHTAGGVVLKTSMQKQCMPLQPLVDCVCCICRIRFWWDLTAWIPWDYLALLVLGDFHAGSSIVARVPLLRLLRLVRDISISDLLSCTALLSCPHW